MKALGTAKTATMLVLATCVFGCTESTLIRSYPPGAKIYVNDAFVGIAPVHFSIPHKEFEGDFHVRVEHAGYLPLQAELKKTTCPGRVAGSILTLGIVGAVRGTTCFVYLHDFALEEAPGHAPSGSAAQSPSPENRLQRLERLRAEGTITPEEYERYRKSILDGL